eukprot:TRINITY_DN3188_c0_g1_i2.p1 TRINITY_DN3188_c0_g1~~TRINITY_DN3188_c0_g1_i2.p1  ORF type:complete len:51 (-),score=5.33 TRINITY_DN3188_c0_g1_i2:537-689(-)
MSKYFHQFLMNINIMFIFQIILLLQSEHKQKIKSFSKIQNLLHKGVLMRY